VWGDGEQTRSYCYIDDCVEGIYRIMRSSYQDPLNLGRDEMVSINQLVDAVARVVGKTIRKDYDLSKPQGVRGRNSDNSLTRQVLG
jgi:nucleoside-diphosphate-sugar epimerase